jgi:hypothetical protein
MKRLFAIIFLASLVGCSWQHPQGRSWNVDQADCNRNAYGQICTTTKATQELRCAPNSQGGTDCKSTLTPASTDCRNGFRLDLFDQCLRNKGWEYK